MANESSTIDRFYVVLTNPPFGKKSSYTIVNGEGKAAIIVTDNVLFEGGAGSGESRSVARCSYSFLRLKTNTLKYDDLADFIKCMHDP